MKIYTKTGDAGTTSLVGGKRVSKCSPRLEAYGTVDELNSHLGLLLSIGVGEPDAELLRWVQNKLFDLGALLATEPESKYQPAGLSQDDVERLEGAIDRIDALLPQLRCFILPGGTMAASEANVARTVARRAERRMVALTEGGIEVQPTAMRFVNRLSDYLFILARLLNQQAGVDTPQWHS